VAGWPVHPLDDAGEGRSDVRPEFAVLQVRKALSGFPGKVIHKNLKMEEMKNTAP